ncbi:MAG: alkaline phosphatase D family protein [Mycobacteriales bacterium]
MRRTVLLVTTLMGAAVTSGALGLSSPALAACTPTDTFSARGLFPTTATGGVLSAGAGFGAAFAAGDFNGDGRPDLAVGAPSDLVSGVAAGAVYVFPGSASGLGAGTILTETNINAGNEAGDKFGAALAAGDVNHDGYADLVAGIPGEADGSVTAAGAIALFLGGPNGLTTGSWIDQKLGGGGNEASDQFGYSVAVGDLDGDGYADVAIGDPGEQSSGSTNHAGAVYVYKGSATGLVKGWFEDQVTAGVGSNEAGDQFGYAVAIGNVTGDSHPDLAVGAPGEGPSGDPANSGALYVLPSGKETGAFARSQTNIGANEAGDRLGSALAIGDFDKDGYGDVAVGVPGEAPGAAPAGGSVVVFPGASSAVATGYWLNSNRAGDPLAAGDKFGGALAASDVDGDGYADLLVGAPSGHATAGVAYLYGGRPRVSGGTRSLDLGYRVSQSDLAWGGDESGDHYGSAAAFADFDGDGRTDLVIGDSGEAPAGTTVHSGAAVAVTGLTTGLTLGPIAGGAGTDQTSVWVRGNHAGTFQVQYRPTGTADWTDAPETAFGGADVDYTATVPITGLTPGTAYDMRVAVGCRVDHLQLGNFQTMPDTSGSTLSWVYGADTMQFDGLNGSTEWQQPLKNFAAADAVNPQFMIQDGDQMYSDAYSTKPTVTSDYFHPYQEVFGEQNERAFMRHHDNYMMWDDHEIINNWDSGQTGLYLQARPAYQIYQGSHNPAPYRPGVLYYSFRAGPADFFMMDGRSYRSDSAAADNGSKTMLGAQQLADLESWLKNSTAPWKFLITADPFANMTCDLSTPNHDSWCGYRTERQKIWDFITANNITGVVAVSGDHHWSGVFKEDNTAAKIYEFMPNPMGRPPASPATSASDMIWHYDSAQLVYGLFQINGNTLTMTMRRPDNSILRTFTLDTAGNITQS